jgi:hypothetical protein
MAAASRSYRGYLSPHVKTIYAMAEAGASTREIAEAVYAAGARSQTTDRPRRRPGRQLGDKIQRAQVRALRALVLHVLQRFGLRTRKKRGRHYFDSASAIHDPR